MKKLLLIILIAFILVNCSTEDEPTPPCSIPPEVTISSIQPISVCNAIDGEIDVNASGGTPPLEFSIDRNAYQQSTTFTGLGADSYTITVRDAEDCTNTVEAVIDPVETDLTASVTTTEDTQCVEGNGSIEVSPSGGVPPYEVSLGEGFINSLTIENLDHGDYEVVIKDAEGCDITLEAMINQGNTNTSYENEVETIIFSNCAISGCHNGDNGQGNFTDFSEVKERADDIKTRTQNKSMPPNNVISDEEIALISCWVDEGAKDN